MRGRPLDRRRRRRRPEVCTIRTEPLESRQLLATFAVTSTADSGPGSLRDAISQANGSGGPDEITFNITGGGIQTINLLTELPEIIDEVEIDGTTQPGFDPTTFVPQIVLNGESAGSFADGLRLASSADGSVIRGLAINRFDGDGIVVESDNTLIVGNVIGLNPAGNIAQGNGGVGIEIDFASNNQIGGTALSDANIISGNGSHGIRFSALEPGDSTNNVVLGNRIGTDRTGSIGIGNGGHGVDFFGGGGNTIGGSSAGSRNLISGNDRNGINFFGGSSILNEIFGNFIGTNALGNGPIPNGDGGIFGLGNSNTIGGPNPGEGNLISGNTGPGIGLQGQLNNSDGQPVPNIIQGNLIGTDITGQNALGNIEAGVRIFSNGVLIGGSGPGAGNVIAFTQPNVFGEAAGVSLILSSEENSILSNSIFANGSLGIDFNSNQQVLPNDLNDVDTNPSNNGQNYPVITAAETGGGVSVITGTLNSKPNTEYLIQLFANNTIGLDPSGFGEGEIFLREIVVVTDDNGNASFEEQFDADLDVSQFVSSTATEINLGDTSEFSRSVQVVSLPTVDLAITTSVPSDPVLVGDEVTVSLSITNSGPAGATDVMVFDQIPANVEFVSATDGVVPDENGLLLFDLGTVGLGVESVVSYTIRPIIVGTLSNQASVSTSVIDLSLSNNTSTDTFSTFVAPGTSVLSFFSDEFNVVESSPATITVSRSNGNDPVSVNFEVLADTAMETDFIPISGTLNFGVGEVTKSFTVDLVDDTAIEGTEQAILRLSDPSEGGVLGQPLEATLNIIDNDPITSPFGQFRFGAPSFTIVEGTAFANIPVERFGGVTEAVGVTVRTIGGSATAGGDFEPIDFQLLFSNGDNVPKLVTIELKDDEIDEPNELFTVELSDPVRLNNPDAGSQPTLGGPSSTLVTLIDNDEPPPPPAAQVIQFASPVFTVSETGMTAEIGIQRSSGAGTVSVQFTTMDGTAASGERFESVDTEVTFGPGETSTLVEIPIINTDSFEGDQTVLLDLDLITEGPTLGDPSMATLTIVDDESDPNPPPPPMPEAGMIQFAVGEFVTTEESGGITATLNRVNGSEGVVTLFVIPDAGDATAGEDYVRDAFPVVFEDGQETATVTIPIIDDNIVEGTEAFGLFLTPPTGGATLGMPDAAVVVVNDGDVDPTPPTVVDVFFVGPGVDPIGLAVTFSEPIDPNGAIIPFAYSIVSAGVDQIPGTPDDVPQTIADISYNPATLTVAMVTTTALNQGTTFAFAIDGVTEAFAIRDAGGNFLDGDGDGVAGGFYITTLRRSNSESYVDINGDRVQLILQGGGTLELVQNLQTGSVSVEVLNPIPGVSVLSGSVVNPPGPLGDGITVIASLTGITTPAGNVIVNLSTPPFFITELIPAAIDALLEDPVGSALDS